MKYSVDQDQLATSEASWSGSTLFSKEYTELWKGYLHSMLIRLNLTFFSGQYKNENHNKILNQARQRITQAMGVMPIRIQAPKLKYDNSFVYISAMLLDRSPYEGKKRVTLKEITFELCAFVSPQIW